MPTYEYACTQCGQHVEVFQRLSEEPLTTCGVCGGTLRKVFHPAGIVFKGSGFYATDNRSKPKAASGDASSGSSGSSTTGTDGGSGPSGPSGSSGSSGSDGGSKTAAGTGGKTS
ncbi:MAG: FmdB family zinc ribbon protein [Candidatus Velamenicoccus archaeovorus]